MKNKTTEEMVEVQQALSVKPTEELSLQAMVNVETEKRKILKEFIANHMVKGTDYGGIKMGGRMSKDSLFKPGAEKMASLLNLRPETVRDAETWEMAGSKEGLFCYRCNLYSNRTGELVGDGLGACAASEKGGNINNAIKIAKKRAFVDAILTTGALSDFFTQDLEDMVQPESPREFAQRVHTEEPEEQPEKVHPKIHLSITNDQKMTLISLIGKKGKTMEDIDKAIASTEKFVKQDGTHATNYKDLSHDQAASLIARLTGLPDYVEEEVNLEDVDAALSAHKQV